MKRLIFRVAILILTFSLGVGLDRVLSRPAQIQVPQPVAVSIAEPLAPAPVVTTQPPVNSIRHMIFDFDQETFWPDGTYVLAGRKPREFAEFHSIGLWYEVTDAPSRTLSLQTLTGDKFEGQTALFGLVTERKVFFVTPAFESGFEYRFDGEFLRHDFSSAANANKPVLRGTLTKTKKGRKVAESVVSLSLEFDHC